MKTTLAFAAAALVLGLSACGSDSQISPRTRDVVEGRVNLLTSQFLRATQERDADAAGAFLSDASDAVFASDGTIVATAGEFRTLMEGGFSQVAEQTLEPGTITTVVFSANGAVVTGNAVFTITGNDGASVEGLQAYTLVWRKAGEDWKIVQAHFSTQPVSITN